MIRKLALIIFFRRFYFHALRAYRGNERKQHLQRI